MAYFWLPKPAFSDSTSTLTCVLFFYLTWKKHKWSLVKNEIFHKKILEWLRGKSFSLLLWQKICELCSQFAASESWWNTNCFFWVYRVHLVSPALLIRWRLVGRLFALLLFLHRGLSCFWLRLCQRAVDGHRLSVWGQIEGTFQSCSDTKKMQCMIPGLKWGGSTCVTIPLMSPVLVGRRTVLDSLARLEKANTYCSATLREAAASPFCTVHNKLIRINRKHLIKFMLTNGSRSSPVRTEPPTGRGSPWISPLLSPRLPELHLEGT